jgi:hypothetical protein
MRPLLMTALLALAAPQADAGDVSIDFGFRHKGLRIGFGYHRNRRPRHVQRYCDRFWVPGYYENVRQRVWVPGHWDRCCDRRGHGRHRYRDHHCRKVWTPGHYEIRLERVWHSGHWEYACNSRGHRHERRARRF